MIEAACKAEGIPRHQLSIHSDNGAPMKCATLKARLEQLGVAASFSRPGVSDDNPYSEALFHTLKYGPDYPRRPFESIDHARAWVARFVAWHIGVHRHGAIRFVTPAQRHHGCEHALLMNCTRVNEAARKRHPARWARPTRNWTPIAVVRLNPDARHAHLSASG